MHRSITVLFTVLLTSGCFTDAGPAGNSTTTETGETGSSESTDGSTTSADTDGSEDTDPEETGSMDMGVQPDMGEDPVELPDPIVHYGFNGNGDDEVGDADASEIWILPMAYVNGYEGLAAEIGPDTGHFGASNTLGMDFAALAEASSFSMAFRLQPVAYQTNHTLWQMGNKGESFSTNSFSLRIQGGYFEVLTETGEGEDHATQLGQVPALDEWHTLVFVFDGTDASLYMDGELAGGDLYTVVDTDAYGINFGAAVDHGAPFEGLLDDIKIYDTVLNSEQAEYLSGL